MKVIVLIIAVFLSGCSVKVLTFGVENAHDSQEIIIGVKKTNVEESE